jgi:hypothetical protein
MLACAMSRRAGRAGVDALRLALLGSVSWVALNGLGEAQAGQLPLSVFQTYNPANA